MVRFSNIRKYLGPTCANPFRNGRLIGEEAAVRHDRPLNKLVLQSMGCRPNKSGRERSPQGIKTCNSSPVDARIGWRPQPQSPLWRGKLALGNSLFSWAILSLLISNWLVFSRTIQTRVKERPPK